MVAFRFNNVQALAMCNGLVDALDAGAGPGVLEIFTGAPPTNPEDADTGTKLADLTFSDPAFGNATDQNPDAQAAANPITGDTSINATGTAGYYRAKDSNGVVVAQGDVAVAGADINFNSVDFVVGAQCDVTSLNWRIKEGA